MINKTVKSLLVSTTLIISCHSASVSANDCSISINTKESVKCLQRKINHLESQLTQYKSNQNALPQGAIISFNSKTCPDGWSAVPTNNHAIAIQNGDSNIISCQKS